MKTILTIAFIGWALALGAAALPAAAQENAPVVAEAARAADARVAPGETLPVSVQLSNFGSQRRADVEVHYQLFDRQGRELYAASETVAVDTTASFIKELPLPRAARAGAYTARVSIQYEHQEVPAVSRFQFSIEPKWFGVFRSDFLLYALLAFGLSSASFVIGRRLMPRRGFLFHPHDYGSKKRAQRLYYELIEETIAQMRERVGDDALYIADAVPGLELDVATGEVLAITRAPQRVLEKLMLRYEALLGRRLAYHRQLLRMTRARGA